MTNKDNLTIKMGSIAELCNRIRVTKAECNKRINDIVSNNIYSQEHKNITVKQYKEDCNKKVAELQAKIKDCIEDVKADTFKPFEYSQELMQDVDYLATMQKAGALNSAMINNVIAKNKGNENNMLYLRQKMKDAGVSTACFDEYMFSEYQVDLNGQTKFVEPTAFFDNLEKTINAGNDLLIAHALGTTEKIIGVESNGLKNYDADIMASHNTETPVVL